MEKSPSNVLRTRRSVGVTLIAIISIILSIGFAILALSTPLMSPRIAGELLFSLGFLISGIGILKLKNWSRILLIFMMLGFLFLVLLQISVTKNLSPRPSSSYLLFLVLPAISIYYLIRPKVERQFMERNPKRPKGSVLSIIFAWLEIIVGAVASIAYIGYTLWFFISGEAKIVATADGLGAITALPVVLGTYLIFPPALLSVIGGIGVLRRKRWAVFVNISIPFVIGIGYIVLHIIHT